MSGSWLRATTSCFFWAWAATGSSSSAPSARASVVRIAVIVSSSVAVRSPAWLADAS